MGNRKKSAVICSKAEMVTIAPVKARPLPAENADGVTPEDFKPLSAEEARQWRAEHPPLSPWPVVWVQAGMGLMVVMVAWFASKGAVSVVWSAGYGVLAAWLPAMLFARMVARRMRIESNAASALTALMVWEGIKIVLTLALLLAAPKILAQVQWLALLAGFVVTIKAAWAAMWLMSVKRRSTVPMN